MTEPDIKPRSRDVTDGLESTAARGMLRAVGMGDDDWEKPQIGVASSWNEITPCNLSLQRLAQAVKHGVHAAGWSVYHNLSLLLLIMHQIGLWTNLSHIRNNM
jgi:dihydroxy-acid dehydratase